jgi:predicted metal-dependent hydrolase
MDLIKESFQRLFPEKEFNYLTNLEYNRRLSNFNANVRLERNNLSINLNLQWKDIEDEIKIGLIQSLLLKLFKQKTDTQNIDLYNNFIKKIPILTPKTKTHPTLESSFNRVNQDFFQDTIEQPNLTWGTASRRKLASYNFHDDTITVSTIFKDSKEEVLDYLMYHELLHKYHKFNNKNGRSHYHTPKFKNDENLYPQKKEIDLEINQIIRNSRPKKQKTGFFGFLTQK